MYPNPATRSIVDEINEQVNRLHAEISLLRQTQNQYASFIHRLPDEVLSSIFTYTVPTNHFNSLATKRESSSPRKACSEASSLGTICRQWRRVAVSTHHIWRRISIAVRTGRYELHAQEAALAALRMHLTRSGDVPLEVEVHLDGGKACMRGVAYTGMPRGGLDEMVLGPDTMCQIGRLRVQMDRDWEYGLGMLRDVLKRGYSEGSGGARRLKSFDLEFQACEGQIHAADATLREVLDAVVSAETVNDLSLKFRTGTYRIKAPHFIPPLPTDGTTFDLHLPPAMITHAELHNPSIEKVEAFISCTPSLVSLRLDMGDSSPYATSSASDARRPDLHLAHLRELSITLPRFRTGRERSNIFLRRILGGITTCSALEILAISGSDPCSSAEDIRTEEIHESIVDFLVRSGASKTLIGLSLQRMPLKSSHIVTILQKVPNLTDLNVVENTPPSEDGQDSRAFGVEVLASMIASASYLPRLRRLGLRIWKDCGNWMGWFSDMVENRHAHREGADVLESVSLVIISPSCIDRRCMELERLRRVQAQGNVAVRVLYGTSGSKVEVVGCEADGLLVMAQARVGTITI
ncbi:hypothetical protein PM082_009820 [Marasmius tenuissimus]|nr:hypothetical protein PM082_009820 [Marasmius tenuissimus]